MKPIYYIAACDRCDWVSEQCDTPAEAVRAGKQHLNDNPHADYDDVPLWDGPMGTGAGSISNI